MYKGKTDRQRDRQEFGLSNAYHPSVSLFGCYNCIILTESCEQCNIDSFFHYLNGHLGVSPWITSMKKISRILLEKPPGYTYIMAFRKILFGLSHEIHLQIFMASTANIVKEEQHLIYRQLYLRVGGEGGGDVLVPQVQSCRLIPFFRTTIQLVFPKPLWACSLQPATCMEKCLVFGWDTISYIIYLLSLLFCEAWQLSQQIRPRRLIQTPDRRVTVRHKDGKTLYVNETSVCLDPWLAFLRIAFFLCFFDSLRLIDALSPQMLCYLSKPLPRGSCLFLPHLSILLFFSAETFGNFSTQVNGMFDRGSVIGERGKKMKVTGL